MGLISVSSVTVRTAPKLGGWVPLCKTITRGSVWSRNPPSIPVGGHVTARDGPIGRGAGERGKIGQNRPKMTQEGPETPCGPCLAGWLTWMTKDMPNFVGFLV